MCTPEYSNVESIITGYIYIYVGHYVDIIPAHSCCM